MLKTYLAGIAIFALFTSPDLWSAQEKAPVGLSEDAMSWRGDPEPLRASQNLGHGEELASQAAAPAQQTAPPAQQTTPAPPQAAPPGPQAAPPEKPQGPTIPKAEEDDFNKLLAEKDLSARKRLIDEFLQKYPDSILNGQVHRLGTDLGQRTNNPDMIIQHGEKTLAAFPGDFPVMSILANAYAERNELDKSEATAHKALQLIAAFQKPPEMPEEEWARTSKALMGGNYSTIGMIHLRRAQASKDPAEKKMGAEKAVTPLKKALENQPKDDYSYYYLGIAYVLLNDYFNAESALAKAVALNSVASGNARKLLEDLYKLQHKNSLEGLDQVIAKAKSELEP